ncbi:MAG: RidA family protein [Planctomycetia bacterium]|nr:RidA family protein [Planctomycetia bacterium]
MTVANSPQERLASLGLVLPPVGKPAGAYKPCLVVERMVYVSGHLPLAADGTLIRGKVGVDLDADAGKVAARQVGLAILATLVANLGSLDRVGRVIKLMGLVNCPPDFVQHPHVINGCSELFAEVWGPDHGVGVRSAFGAGSLPLGVPVEIEAVFELA